MAFDDRKTDTTVIDIFKATPFRFQFVQAVRILHRLYPHQHPVGTGTDPKMDAIQLKSHVSFSMPPSDILSFHEESWGPPTLTINFMTLAGIHGPLPNHYGELILERNKVKDFALESFLNIFNHRLLSLFYRIQTKVSIGIEDIPPERTDIGQGLLAFTGLSPSLQRKDLALSSLVSFAGLLWQKPHSTEGLKALLHAYFRLPIKVLSFKGRWKKIPQKDRSSLGSTLGTFQKMSQDVFLGARYWDQITGVCLCLGPLDLETYQTALPDGEICKAIKNMIHLYLSPENDVDLEISLAHEQIPPTALSDGRVRLGWLSCLSAKPHRTMDQTVLTACG